jgi:Carboxypeptidase regulatory-like domain
MVSSARQAIACILLIISAVSYVRAQTAAEKAPTATISGKVTVTGKGVPGIGVSLALVESYSSYPTRYRSVTDDNGNYRIANVTPGMYLVIIKAPAFARVVEVGREKNILVNKGETIENVDFDLVRGGVITGKVTDTDGHPLIEENIYVIPAGSPERRTYYYGMGMVRTDDRGIYRVFGLGPGSYTVAAGQGEGGFESSERAVYKRTFHPDAAEASEATVIELKEGDEATNVDIIVGRAINRYSATGRIVDGQTGRPVANVSYGVHMFINPNSGSSLTTGAVSNSEGEFKLNSLAPGKYGVFLEPPPETEWRADILSFEVIDQDVTGLTIKTSRAASASGAIVLEGTTDKAVFANLTKGRIYAYVMNDGTARSSSPSGRINADGTFRISGMQSGVFLFGISSGERFKIVRVERGGVVYPQGIEIKETNQITGLRLLVNYANGTVRGMVRLENGKPAEGRINVTLTRIAENDVGPLTGDSNASPQVDARGQFFVEGLLPGTYEVTASYIPDMHSAWRQTRQQVVVANGVVTDVTLTIDPNAPPSRP